MAIEVIPKAEWPLWRPPTIPAVVDVHDGSSCAVAACQCADAIRARDLNQRRTTE